MVGAKRSISWRSCWVAVAILLISLLAPVAALAQGAACVSPNPVSFASPTDTPTIVETGQDTKCDQGSLGLYPTNSSENGAFAKFNTTTTNGVQITFIFMSCNFVTSGGPGSGGCLPDGSATLNTYYQLQLATTTETSDSVTVYSDPLQSGTPTNAIPISLTINQQAATTTTVSSSLNPATAGQTETFTATVTSTSTVNEGTVAFSSDSSTISGCGTSPVSSGTATCTVALAAGSHSIVATYAGDTNFATSTSSTLTQAVNTAPTATQSISSKALTQNHAASFTPVTGGGGTTPLAYSISPALPTGLSISPTTGAISGTPSVTSGATTYTVKVTDANSVQATNTFSLTVNSAVTAAQSIPTAIATQNHSIGAGFIPVTGGGGTPLLAYSINPALPTGLSINSSTGTITGTASVASGATTYTVTVTDANGATASNTFSLTVNSPPTATQSIASRILTLNHASAGFTPVTGGGGTTPLAFSISPALPTGLSINLMTGAITGTPGVTSTATTYTVTVTDANSATALNTFSLTVNSAPTATQSIAAKILTQNHAASFTPVTGGGGTPSLAYSISPTLPAGLSIDPTTGAITGTPSVPGGGVTYTVTVTDANGATATNTFQMAVNTPVVATQAVASTGLTVNHAATSFTPVTAGGGLAPLAFSISPTLPTGLSIVSTTGAITGTPSVTSVATTYTVTATDANGATASNSFTLTVNSAPTATQSVASEALTQNHAATSFTPVTGGGGTPALAYSISPTLPSGLSLDPTTGAITGNPSATSVATTYTVTVTDANSATASNTFSLTVNSAVTAAQSVATAILTQNHAATSFTPVTGGGGTGTLGFSINPTLPTGLSISPTTGVVSGNPSVTSVATTYTVTVTDANSATATATFSLTVNGAVTATQAIASQGLTLNHTAVSFTPVTGGGGTGTLTFSINPTLPAGLSISPTTGVISGTPSVTSTATTYTVTVTDANSATASNTFSLTVNPVVTATQSVATTILTQNHAATGFTPVTGGGGTAPLSYSASPTLPTGLSINPTTGAITGNPSVTSVATTYTVTVADANNATASAMFSLTVNSAVTATQAVAATSLTQNHAAIGFTPVTGGGGTGALAYSISPTLPTGLSISPTTGAITGTPSATSVATTYTVTVTDTNTATATATFSLTVNTAPTATLAVSSATLTANHATTAFTPVNGGGGTGALAYSISPTLPTGLSISGSTGQVSGTPTAASAAGTYTVTVTDTNGATAANSFSLAVSGPVTATAAVASTGLTVDIAATPFTPVTGAGGVGTLSYSVSPTLPAGIALSPTTGQVAGLPTVESGAATYTVTVTDGNGATAMASFSLAVNGPVTASSALATTTLTENHANPSFIPVTGGGGTTPYVYTVSPTLPAGLSLSSSTGAVTGAPSVTSAAMSYTVTVTDANGATAHAGFSLTVNTAVTATQSVAMTSLKVHQLATAFTPVTGGGGTPLLSYSVSPGLPAGLSLDSTSGTISGTPTVTQSTTSYTVTVTDTNGATATAGFSLAVTTTTSSVAVTTSVNPSNDGQSVTFTAAVSGSGAVPTGTVTFKDGGTTLFSGTLVKQLASYTTSTLAPGLHSISVAYSGDSSFAGSSGGLTQVVGGAPTTPGQSYPYQGTLTGFSGPGGGIYDPVNDHILICDTGNQRVEVLNAQTLATVAIIGTTGVAGSDNAHLNDPTGVAFDSATDQIFVADTGNNRIQVFNAATFAYVETIGAQLTSDGKLVAAAGNTTFTAPGGMHVDSATGRLYVADTGNQRVQIFDTATLAYVGTLGTSGVSGSDNTHFNAPKDVVVNTAAGEILVADSGNSRVQRFDAVTLAYKGTIGGPGLNVGNSDYLGTPSAIAYDALSNLVLVADSTEERVEVFDALSYTYVLTLGTTGSAGSSNSQFSGPSGVVIDTAHERVLIGDQGNNRVQIFSIVPTVAFASVLPGSRSVELGKPATIFASLINAGTTPLEGCQVALPVTAPSGLTLSYQTTNPATNALTGTADTPATIPANDGIQSFLVTLQGSQSFSAPGMALDFDCLGIGPAAVVTGVDTVDLAMATAPVADVIALAATISNNGIAEIPAGGASAFAVATSNVGATSEIVASVDTGTASLPLSATLCQSNPSTGACLATPASSVLLTDTAGAAPTFSVFLQASGTIPFAPATSRIFVRFKDPAGGIHGSTSVAVETK
jgi:hypothetical protein